LDNKDSLDKKVTDKTCCVHAEQRAIMDALKSNSKKLENSRLYFTRIDKKGNQKFAGEPYCTMCSKMTLDAGISEFVLYHKEGIAVYDAEEYNDLSFMFKEK
jgi:deoxycytidylate deaminase